MARVCFSIDYSKRLSKCKKCDAEISKGQLRLAKILVNTPGMKMYYHVECLFYTFHRGRYTTKAIQYVDDIGGFANINKNDQKIIIDLIKAKSKLSSHICEMKKKNDTYVINSGSSKQKKLETEISDAYTKHNSDDRFEVFQTICNMIAQHRGHLQKTQILKSFFQKDSYNGDQYTFVKLLLPSVSTRVFHLSGKQLTKLFSQIFSVDHEQMLYHLNKGDISETCGHFFKNSKSSVKPKSSSNLTIQAIDSYLDQLATISKEADQLKFFRTLASKSTENDLVTFIRLIKKDLKINAMTKIILDAIAPNAYQAFQMSHNLSDVLSKASKAGLHNKLSISVDLMTPFKPMLAEACKSEEQVFFKCRNTVLAETKYDGERIQIHKNGTAFKYFSRNLKKVQAHKVDHLKEFIPKAFPAAKQLILDAEVLLYDSVSQKPLPFGTLGVNKKNSFKNATVCLFVFDCLYLNGKDLMNKPLMERRKILEENMSEIPGRIMIAKQKVANNEKELRGMIMAAIKEGLEGLVLKDSQSIYEPGKRHWLKMKKEHLHSGSMADTADLVVLGAYYGNGNKGGMKSVFLMGVYDEKQDKWLTVTKVGNGFDEKTLGKMQKQIDMTEINKNVKKVPHWLIVSKTLVPDFVVNDPRKSPVWELTGAEFSKSNSHTADGISIRFPRVTRVRHEKSWNEATNLKQLKILFKTSKETEDVQEVENKKNETKRKLSEDENEMEKSSKKIKTKESNSNGHWFVLFWS